MVGRSTGQGCDLDQVVSQDAVSGPDPGPVEVIEAGAVPPVLPFEGADPSFAPGAPLDGSAERSAVLVGLAGLAGSALAGDHHGSSRSRCPECAEVVDDLQVRHSVVELSIVRTPRSCR